MFKIGEKWVRRDGKVVYIKALDVEPNIKYCLTATDEFGEDILYTKEGLWYTEIEYPSSFDLMHPLVEPVVRKCRITEMQESDDVHIAYPSGMTLRDYFAAKCMSAFVTENDGTYKDDAKNAYICADYMIAERSK